MSDKVSAANHKVNVNLDWQGRMKFLVGQDGTGTGNQVEWLHKVTMVSQHMGKHPTVQSWLCLLVPALVITGHW